MKRYYAIILLMLFALTTRAQDALKGTVVESGTNTRLKNVFIEDKNNKQVGLTDKDGNFRIRAGAGHILIFTSPGYRPDTLFLTDLRPKRIELTMNAIALREVNITARRPDFNPQAEYPEVYERAKVYAFSPSTWFSKQGKDARRLKRYFQREAQERHVDNVFSRAYVGSIIPLKGQDLENFITLYRPSYAFLRSNEGGSLVAYINDSYKKFLALPADKRSLQPLTAP